MRNILNINPNHKLTYLSIKGLQHSLRASVQHCAGMFVMLNHTFQYLTISSYSRNKNAAPSMNSRYWWSDYHSKLQVNEDNSIVGLQQDFCSSLTIGKVVIVISVQHCQRAEVRDPVHGEVWRAMFYCQWTTVQHSKRTGESFNMK